MKILIAAWLVLIAVFALPMMLLVMLAAGGISKITGSEEKEE